MAARHLVARGDLAGLSHPNPDQLVDAGRQLILILSCKHLDVDDLASLAVGNAQGVVLDIASFLSKDSAQQLFFGSEFRLALRSYLPNQDIPRVDFRSYKHDAFFIQVTQAIFTHVWNVPGYLLRTKLGVPSLSLILFDMDGGELVLFKKPFADDNGVFVVVTFPAHKRDQHVLPQRQIAVLSRGAVRQGVTYTDNVALIDDGTLRHAGALIAAYELIKRVGMFFAFCVRYHNAVAGDGGHYAVAASEHNLA